MYALEVIPSLTKTTSKNNHRGGARLELGEGVRVVSEAEGVKVIAAGVHLVEALAARAAVHSVALDRAHQQHLAGHNGDDGLRVHQGGVAQVVQAAGGEDLRAGLPPDGLAEGDAVLGQQLWGDAAQRAQHGPPCVDHLDLAVPARATADASVFVCNGQCFSVSHRLHKLSSTSVSHQQRACWNIKWLLQPSMHASANEMSEQARSIVDVLWMYCACIVHVTGPGAHLAKVSGSAERPAVSQP